MLPRIDPVEDAVARIFAVEAPIQQQPSCVSDIMSHMSENFYAKDPSTLGLPTLSIVACAVQPCFQPGNSWAVGNLLGHQGLGGIFSASLTVLLVLLCIGTGK